jgi:hypothetical protein
VRCLSGKTPVNFFSLVLSKQIGILLFELFTNAVLLLHPLAQSAALTITGKLCLIGRSGAGIRIRKGIFISNQLLLNLRLVDQGRIL